MGERPAGTTDGRSPTANGPTVAATGRTPRAGREGTNGRCGSGGGGWWRSLGPRTPRTVPSSACRWGAVDAGAAAERTRHSRGCAGARPDPARRGSSSRRGESGVFPLRRALALSSSPTVAVLASPKGLICRTLQVNVR